MMVFIAGNSTFTAAVFVSGHVLLTLVLVANIGCIACIFLYERGITRIT